MKIPPIAVHLDDKQFLLCLPPVITAEGYPGDDDDPHDPGGRTHAGITQREYNVYRRNKGLPQLDVWHASWDEVCDIYYGSYWLPFCPKLWVGVNQMLFDQSVNQGQAQAAKNLQRSLNAYYDPGIVSAMLRWIRLRSSLLTVDGHIGPATLDVLKNLNDRRDFLKTYFDFDMSFYRRLRNFARYGNGWEARAYDIYEAALKLYEMEKIT